MHVYDLTEKEEASRVFRRSLYVVADMQEGGGLSPEEGE